MTKTRMTQVLRATGLGIALAVQAGGCAEKGPAERAGENIDKGVQNVKDSVNPPGPLEKAGRTVDKTVNP